MRGVYLKIYVGESERYRGHALYEWLLREARVLGVHGGSAFRAMAGFGRHGRLHEDSFFELAGELPVEVGFLTDRETAQRLLDRLAEEKLNLFYAVIDADYGTCGENA